MKYDPTTMNYLKNYTAIKNPSVRWVYKFILYRINQSFYFVQHLPLAHYELFFLCALGYSVPEQQKL